MDIKVTKLTDASLMNWACSLTINSDSHINLASIYEAEHSPMRTQLFKVELTNVPTFVSVHIVRHATVGQMHFVKSNRSDRGGNNKEDRWTPINHGMILNAQHLIDMARRRLCYKSHIETVHWMTGIKLAVSKVDPDLANNMVAECIYRGGICHELVPCGVRSLRR